MPEVPVLPCQRLESLMNVSTSDIFHLPLKPAYDQTISNINEQKIAQRNISLNVCVKCWPHVSKSSVVIPTPLWGAQSGERDEVKRDRLCSS